MSRKYKSTYSGFQRHILAEFMSKKQLRELDVMYNLAKATRELKLVAEKLRTNKK